MTTGSPTVHEVWRAGVLRLNQGAVATESPELDARVLLCQALETDLTGLVARYREACPDDARDRFDHLVARRSEGHPVAWLVGRQEFRGLDFQVGEGVLVPRADTETLVEAALEVAALGSGPLRFVDVCTGSGCVAVALTCEIPSARQVEAHAVDLSPQALSFARRNALLVSPPRTLSVHEGDLLSGVKGRWDLVVSNPPYLTPAETEQRVGPAGWKEPALALNGGGTDGLDLVRKLIVQAASVLNPRGWLLLEAADAQMNVLGDLLSAPAWETARVWLDLAGQRRVIGACRAPDWHPEDR